MLARFRFRASSCACKNDFVAAAACFVSLPVTKSAHGFASGEVARQMVKLQAQLPDWGPGSDHCPTRVLAREASQNLVGGALDGGAVQISNVMAVKAAFSRASSAGDLS
jgi:hypothetical protein